MNNLLVLEAQQGNFQKLDCLFDFLYSYTKQLAAIKLSNLPDAEIEECTSSFIEKVFSKKLYVQWNPEKGANFKTWISIVFSNFCFDYQKQMRKRLLFYQLPETENIESGSNIYSSLYAEEFRGIITEYIDHLKSSEGEILNLKFEFGLSNKDIAKKTGENVNTVGVVIYRRTKEIKKLVRQLS